MAFDQHQSLLLVWHEVCKTYGQWRPSQTEPLATKPSAAGAFPPIRYSTPSGPVTIVALAVFDTLLLHGTVSGRDTVVHQLSLRLGDYVTPSEDPAATDSVGGVDLAKLLAKAQGLLERLSPSGRQFADMAGLGGDLSRRIMGFLDCHSLSCLGAINRAHHVHQKHQELWLELLRRDYGRQAAAGDQATDRAQAPAKQRYIELHREKQAQEMRRRAGEAARVAVLQQWQEVLQRQLDEDRPSWEICMARPALWLPTRPTFLPTYPRPEWDWDMPLHPGIPPGPSLHFPSVEDSGFYF